MKLFVACLAFVTFACGKDTEKPQTVTLKLADPGPGVSVKKVKEMGHGEEVVVEGRVSNIVTGVAAFNLIDVSLDYCGQKSPEDSCKTPWDYCCEDAGDRAAATISVEKRGADGKIMGQGTHLPMLRLLDVVAAKGKIEKDDHGNVTVVATSWFVRERPQLPDDLHWPK